MEYKRSTIKTASGLRLFATINLIIGINISILAIMLGVMLIAGVFEKIVVFNVSGIILIISGIASFLPFYGIYVLFTGLATLIENLDNTELVNAISYIGSFTETQDEQ